MAVALRRGRAGEALAAAYLELIGFRIEERNARLAGVEVDLVAREGGTRVLVEVKMRGRADYGGPALAVNAAKRQRLLRAARALEQSGERDLRVDVVAVELLAEGALVRHHRCAITE